MKKLSTIILSVFILSFAISCSKDDTPPESNQDVAIVGKWLFETYTHTKNGETSNERSYNNFTCAERNFIILKSDKVVVEQVIGNINDPCVVSIHDGTWSFENHILNVIEDNGAYNVNYDVISLSDEQLVVKLTHKYDSTEYLVIKLRKDKSNESM